MTMIKVPGGVPRTSGLVTVWALVILAVVTAFTAVATWQMLTNRHSLGDYEHHLQTAWAARAGCERAVARLLAAPEGYDGEIISPVRSTRVQVSVKKVPGRPDVFRITSEARYPDEGPRPYVRTAVRSVRRVTSGGVSRIEPVDE